MTKKEQVERALAVSWAIRAMGKSSHAGWDACMERVEALLTLEEELEEE